MARQKLFLLDAYALIYRSYFAFIRNPMSNSEGFNTSTVFGFVNTLEELFSKYAPTHLGVAFDTSAPTFRHAMYPEYKANRQETPEEIKKSIPVIREIIRAWDIPILELPGYEADDVIGTLAKRASEHNFEVYMVTPDKDYMQLVEDRIFMMKPARSGKDTEILGVQEVCDMYHLDSPGQFVDILALMGDASDNIPGAFGIGEKGAMTLIGEYKNIENLLENTDRLSGKLKEKVLASKDNIVLSKTLASICTEVPIAFDPKALEAGTPDREKLSEIYRKMNFRTFLNRLEHKTVSSSVHASKSSAPVQGNLFGNIPESPVLVSEETPLASIQDTPHTYHLVQGPEALQSLVSLLSGQKEFCFDTETTSLSLPGAELVSIAFSIQEKEAWFVPFPADRNATLEILSAFRSVFEDSSIRKIGQNLKFDVSVLKGYGIKVCGELFDTMLAHYLLHPEQRHNMNYLSETYLRYRPVPIEDLIGEKGKNQRNMRSVDLSDLIEYAGEDADITFQLKTVLESMLRREGLIPIASEIEMPLVEVLSDMEMTGVRISPEDLKAFSETLTRDLVELEAEIFALAGMHFNISSPQQLGKVLFEHLKISDSAPKTKTKQFSTQEEFLQKLSDKHPIIDKLLTYRGLKKLLNTYSDALPKLINPLTGKVHTSFNQAITATGRLSSTDPNLQNIPIRDAKGREIRKAFIPTDEEHLFLSADYSQVELRLMAHMSGDEQMIAAFLRNEDIHASTAAKIYGVSLEEVTREMRSKAKTANFGIIYGISVFGLSQRLNIPRSESQALIEGYFRVFPGVRQYMYEVVEAAKQKGYVETLFGRRRYLPEIRSVNANVRGMAERNAINAPIQGTAADIIKKAMIDIYRKMELAGLRSKMILQVHDELVFDVYRPELDQMRNLVREGMENVCSLKVPLLIELGVGQNWLDAH